MVRPAPALLVVALGLAACSEQVLSVSNQPPNVSIRAPVAGARLFEGSLAVLDGVVGDPDGRVAELRYRWYFGEEVVCEGSVSSLDGSVPCRVPVDVPGGQLSILLEAEDPRGEVGKDSVVVDVQAGAAPAVEIVSPGEGSRAYVGVPFTLDAKASDAEELASALTVRWTSDVDGELDVPEHPDDAGRSTGSVTLTQGAHVLRVEVTDSTGKTAADQADLLVGPPNRPPTCDILEPGPDEASGVGTALQLKAVVDDDDQPRATLSAFWSSDVDGPLGAGTPASTGEVVVVTRALSLGVHVLTLIVADETGATCTDTVVHRVGNGPTITVDSPADGLVVRAGEPVTLSVVVADGEDSPPDLSIVWTSDKSGEVARPAAASDGRATVTRDNLPPARHLLTVTVTDSDALSASKRRSVRVNRPPTAPGVGISPFFPDTTDDLVALDSPAAEDPDGDTVTTTWSWTRNGTATSHKGPTVPAADTAKGQIWVVTAQAADDVHAAPAASATALVVNARPVFDQIDIAPMGPVFTGTTVTCTATATDPDGDDVVVTLAWQDPAGNELGTGPTLVVPSLDDGASVRCVATAADDDGGVTVEQLGVALANRPPSVTKVTLTPGGPTPAGPDPASIVRCAGTGVDPDGDTLTWTYAWTLEGAAVGTGPQLDLGAAGAALGDVVGCDATAADGRGATAKGEAEAEVVSATPSISDARIVVVGGGSATAAASLRCEGVDFFDPQGDADASTYVWTVGGLTAGSAATLSGVFSRDDLVACTVTPSDGVHAGAAKTASVVIQDAPPTSQGAAISPLRPVVGDTVACALQAFDDVDGDGDASTFAWTVDGAAAGAGATLGAAFSEGDTIRCTATPRTPDGTTGIPQQVEVVVDTAPTAPVVEVTPGVPGPLNDLACGIATPSTDADLDTLTYEIRWLRNGSPAGLGGTGLGASAEVVAPASGTTFAQVWTCRARAHDGLTFGPWGEQQVTILCPADSGQDASCPTDSCKVALDAGSSYGDGVYWLDPDGLGAFETWCDMTSAGGGWTLVLQTSTYSAYTYDHASWEASTGGETVAWDLGVDQDAFSEAYYTVPGSQTRMCMKRLGFAQTTCEVATHATSTARDLAAGAVMPSFAGQTGLYSTALKAVVSGWSSTGWQRWGWNHGFRNCGGLRFGFSADADQTDSRDAGIGVGIHIQDIQCNPRAYDGFTLGSGYYHFPWIPAPNPTSAGLPAWIWVR